MENGWAEHKRLIEYRLDEMAKDIHLLHTDVAALREMVSSQRTKMQLSLLKLTIIVLASGGTGGLVTKLVSVIMGG